MKLQGNAALLIAMLFMSEIANGQNSIPCTGLDSDHEGVFAYNISGTNVGHQIPSPYNAFGNDIAYYYFSSRDVGNYDPQANYGMHGSGVVTGFPQFTNALALAGKSITNLKVRVNGPNLGADIEGQDWSFNGPIETRYYADGKYAILIDNDTVLVGESGNSTLVIDYNSTSTPFDDEMSGYSDYSIPSVATNDSALMLIANAFLSDIGRYGIRMNFTSFQRAGQTEYNSGNVRGAFYEIQQASIESGSLLIPDLGPAVATCSGDSIMLDAGAGRDSYLWNTGDTTQIIYVKQSGEYFVRIDSAGTKAYSAPRKVTFNLCTNILAPGASSFFSIQPNPALHQIQIQTEHNSEHLVLIYDLLGNLVKEALFNGTSLEIGVQDLKSGIYMIELLNGSSRATKRLVIQ